MSPFAYLFAATYFDFSLPESSDPGVTGSTEFSLYYLLVGAISGILLLLVVYLILALLRRIRRRRHSTIHIPGENGDFFLLPRAVRDFVYYALDEYRDATIRHVHTVARRGGYEILIGVDLAPYTHFRTTKEAMASKVTEDLREIAGVQAPLSVKVNVLRYDAETRPAAES